MNKLKFTKMHGIGNDYIYIEATTLPPHTDLPALSRRLSDRHTGIGGDGIILICDSPVADFRMRIFNADGSEAKMCGNGSRCVGKYVYDKGLTDSTSITLDTLGGIKHITLHPGPEGTVESATVDMGVPSTVPTEIPVKASSPMLDAPVETSAGSVRLTAVSMGNPHGVIFTDDLSTSTVHTLGPELEHHPMWPDRANIEFARLDSPDHITMRVWERGSGETMACGTGACATAVAAHLTGRTGTAVTVSLPGGDLRIEIAPNGHVMMTGGATTVFEGTVEI